MLDLRPLNIVVTGGSGFLGRHLVKLLKSRGCENVTSLSSSDIDLLQMGDVECLPFDADVIFHLAALCGGIGANQSKPASFATTNLKMGLNILQVASDLQVKQLVMVGTLCAFPKDIDRPIEPEDLWNGYPEETNAPYGIAKRTLVEVSKAYRNQYGLNVVNVMPTNLYGTGDNFNPDTSHVIPALIRKFVEANESGASEVVCWGTGKPTRDFLHVTDAAEGIVRAAERLDDPNPVLLGSGLETTMFGLALTIAEIVGYRGNITWDTTKPDGQPRRVVSTRSQRDRLGFCPQMNLREGLAQTVEWYARSKEICAT